MELVTIGARAAESGSRSKGKGESRGETGPRRQVEQGVAEDETDDETGHDETRRSEATTDLADGVFAGHAAAGHGPGGSDRATAMPPGATTPS